MFCLALSLSIMAQESVSFYQVSLDTMDELLNLPPKTGLISAPSVKLSVKLKEEKKDLFSLLYASEANQDRTIVPPSRWATFECKYTLANKLF